MLHINLIKERTFEGVNW